MLVDDKRDARVAPRQVLIAAAAGLLLAAPRCSADFPVEALDKWDWVWKALAFAAFLPLTLRTRLRIEALLLFMILSAASIIIVGGIKTLGVGGGGYGDAQPDGRQQFGACTRAARSRPSRSRSSR